MGGLAARGRRACEVVFTSLPVPADVEAVALGPNGLLEGMKPDRRFSTCPPTRSRWCARSAPSSPRRTSTSGSPVSGGPGGAASGKMAILVGGDEQQFNRHKSVLDAMGDQAAISARSARHDRQAGAQLHQRRRRGGAGRGHDDGHQGRGRPARIVGGGAPGRDRPAAHLRPARQVPLQQLRSADFAMRLLHKDVSLAVGLGRETGCRCGSPTWRSRNSPRR